MESTEFSKTSSFYLTGFFLVFIAGLLWSFGPIVVRHMVQAHQYVFQYLFYRGLSVATILICFLIYREGFGFYKNFLRVGLPGLIGGCALATAMTGFIFSITLTSAAVTLFMLAAIPFIAAIIAYFALREKLRTMTLISMFIAFVGVLIMIYNDSLRGSILGALIGFLSATGFAVYTVTIRWRPETPKFTTVVLAGVFCAIFSFLMLGTSFESFTTMPVINIYLSLLHGCIVASGLILFSFGAKYLPAAELALLTLMEVVGGVVWVWLPVFGINEVPSMTVIIGGFFVTFAVLMHGFGASRKREPVTL